MNAQSRLLCTPILSSPDFDNLMLLFTHGKFELQDGLFLCSRILAR